mgnify:CR=1 FL=1
MATQDDQRNRHFILTGTAETEAYRSPAGGGSSPNVPNRNRAQHGSFLQGQFNDLKPFLQEAKEAQEAAGEQDGFGLQVVFESFPDIELAFQSLARERSGIELMNVRQSDTHTVATVFVPDGKLVIFENMLSAYLDESRDSAGKPRHSTLLNAIAQIRAATVTELWTDDPAVFPDTDEETFWWEVWLPVREDRQATVARFKRLAELSGFSLASGELQFPERTVLLAYGSVGQMKQSVMTLNNIAELRRAKETAEFFDSLLPVEQPEWVDDMLERLTVPSENSDVPYVCLLDTGVTQGHPLISVSLDATDLHTVEPSWGTDDSDGHGSAMAGLALFGDMSDALESTLPINVSHRLESVKLLLSDGANAGDANHHGYLTTEATARPEVTAPNRARAFAMAVTTPDNRDRGRPSSWSAAIDRLASDAEGDGETPRLYVVSAGNVKDPNAWAKYPESNTTDGIHDPAQSWNALTVGAATELIDITESDAQEYQPIAPAGGLSPFSTTSVIWQSQWPLKPDVVFEGGNAAIDDLSAVTMPSLSLLTTHSRPQERLFTTANATSAAAMLGARMSATLMANYPELWPETIRALIVHSAEWTLAMKQAFLPATRQPNKTQIGQLVRQCGFGMPDIDRANWSVENSLTMICEAAMQPFKRVTTSEPTLREMHIHRLPWPLQELEALGEQQVEMRVTLSYFVEPNPSERGFSARYRYESHGFRFDVKRAAESVDSFQARINAAARAEDEKTRISGDDPGWVVGKQNRHKGSLHSDIWRGTAADLASRGVIGIYPTAGWWKTRYKHERYNLMARYALLVSIRAPDVDVELYTAVRNNIAVTVEVST